MKRKAMLAAVLALLLMPAIAGAECAWVLWYRWTSSHMQKSLPGQPPNETIYFIRSAFHTRKECNEEAHKQWAEAVASTKKTFPKMKWIVRQSTMRVWR